MTKKDYIMLAGLFNEQIRGQRSIMELLFKLSDKLKADNPKFDLERFLRAATGTK